jgi:hypothetical protein
MGSSRSSADAGSRFNVQEFKVSKLGVAQIVRDVSILEGENPK